MDMKCAAVNPFHCHLVVATKYDKGVARAVAERVIKTTKSPFASVVYTEEDDPQIELRAIKEATGGKDGGDARRVVLVAQGNVGAAAIRYLCDDYENPTEERRVVWIHSLSVGLDPYKFFEIPNHIEDILITNGKRSQSRALAEYVINSIFYFNRKTWQMQALKKERKWEKFSIQELYGQRMGIMGYGDIGEATARLATAFGVECEALKRSLPKDQTASPYVDCHGVTVYTEDQGSEHFEAHRDRIIAESDYIVNVLPGTPNTMQLFDKDRFATMKSTALYINIGRGCTNNEDDLINALNDGVIRGAAVDVFQTEPLPPFSPLWDVPDDKLMLTSHIGAQTSHQLPALVDRFLTLCERLARGEDMESESVNREFWY